MARYEKIIEVEGIKVSASDISVMENDRVRMLIAFVDNKNDLLFIRNNHPNEGIKAYIDTLIDNVERINNKNNK